MTKNIIYDEGNVSFVFEDAGNEIEAWYRLEAGFEQVHVNGEPIASRTDKPANSTIAFNLGLDEYVVRIATDNPPQGPFIERQYVHGELVSSRMETSSGSTELFDAGYDQNSAAFPKKSPHDSLIVCALQKNQVEIQRQQVFLRQIQVNPGVLYFPRTTGVLGVFAFMFATGCFYLDVEKEFYYVLFVVAALMLLLNLFGYIFGGSIEVVEGERDI